MNSLTELIVTAMFQFTHPRRVRHGTAEAAQGIELSFNSRTREGCDYSPFCRLRFWQMFQFTHPRRVRLRNFPKIIGVDPFQFTHPRRVQLYALRRAVCQCPFQFTHPRRVRPSTRGVLEYNFLVSIHAPAKGATGIGVFCHLRYWFQFTHPRRVRLFLRLQITF